MFDVDNTTMITITNIDEVLSNNNSEYYVPLWNRYIRYTSIVYLFAICFLGLIGNLVALLGSLLHDAIKTDKISLIWLRDLAITDISITIFLYIPLLSTLITKRWVLGQWMCMFSHYVYEVMLLNKIVVIMIVSCYRIWMLKKPPGVKNSLKQKPFLILAFLIPFIMIIPFIVMELTVENCVTFFDPRRFICYGKNYYKEQAIKSLAILSPFLIVPIIVILITNIRLIIVLVSQARKTRRDFRDRRLFISIKIIRLIIVVTYLPAIICMVMEYAYRDESHIRPAVLNKIAITHVIVPLNCAASPILYMLANRHFRAYLLGYFPCCKAPEATITSFEMSEKPTEDKSSNFVK